MSAALDAQVVVKRAAGFHLRVRLVAAPGETVAVMGPSGAGKSTLLATLAGLERLTDGSVRIGDDIVAAAGRHVRPERRGVALLGQDPRLFPHLSARENIAFGPRSRGTARAVARGEADEWLWRVGLDGNGDRRPSQLSGGQQQRVALARALAAAPRLLLLDEPLTSLDPATAGEIRGVLQTQLAAASTTTVLVTHDVIDAVAMASRLTIVENGAVSQSGAVREVLTAPASSFAASIAGLNRVVGHAHAGMWRATGVVAGVVGEVMLQGKYASPHAPDLTDGEPLAAVFRADAVRVARSSELSGTGAERTVAAVPARPGVWVARVTGLEQTLGGVRIHTAEPAVAADVSTATAAELRLSPGTSVILRLDPRDVRLQRVDCPV